MNFKIDSRGNLWVERAGKFKMMDCRFCAVDDRPCCGDDCPHFGEPVHDILIGELSGKEIVDGGWTIEICQGRVLTGEIVDEREVKK
jgi:hypothetical protein